MSVFVDVVDAARVEYGSAADDSVDLFVGVWSDR